MPGCGKNRGEPPSPIFPTKWNGPAVFRGAAENVLFRGRQFARTVTASDGSEVTLPFFALTRKV